MTFIGRVRFGEGLLSQQIGYFLQFEIRCVIMGRNGNNIKQRCSPGGGLERADDERDNYGT